MALREILVTTNQKAGESPEFWAGILASRESADLFSLTGENLGAIADRATGADRWLVAGGDGTLNHVLNFLMGLPRNARPPICYVPYGTGNDFARTLGLSEMAPGDLLREGLDPAASYTPVTVGKCNERYFVNMASGGLFATVTPEANPAFKNLAGRWAYFVNGLGKLLEREPISIRVDGGSPQKALGFFLANARFAGGGLQVSPDSSPFEPGLEFLVVPDLPAKELLALGLELQKDSPDLSAYPLSIRRVKRLRLDFAAEVPVNLDGEQLRAGSMEFSAEPEEVRIFVPVGGSGL